MRNRGVLGLENAARVLILFAAGAGTCLSAHAALPPSKSHPVQQAIAGVREFSGQLIARPVPGASIDVASAAPGCRLERVIPETGEWVISTSGGHDGIAAARLADSGQFQYVEPDWVVSLQGFVPNDSQFGSQWHHVRLSSPEAWQVWRGEPGVTVAVVDSGVQLNHPELAPVLVSGYNSASKTAQADGGDVSDISNISHGTAVAGCIGAIGNNGIGVAGMGWDLRIMPIRATNEGSGSAVLSSVLAGVRWAADHGARVINVSYSGVSSSSVQTTGAYVRDRGGILVWASGNNGSVLGAASDWPDVVIVGAIDKNDQRPTWGNYGPALDVVAPGVSILTTNKGSQYGYHEGTSFAAPLVAGLLGLSWSIEPTLSRSEMMSMLGDSAQDIGSWGEDDVYGRGCVNARDMVLDTWRAAYRFVAPLVTLSDSGPVQTSMWPVNPGRDVEIVSFGDEALNAAALALYGGETLESASIDTTLLDATRAQLRVTTFQIGNAELIVEYLGSDGVWSLLIDPAANVDGPHQHAWRLPTDAIHPEFAVRISAFASPDKVLYVSTLVVADRCTADFDDTGFVDTDDFTTFVTAFEAGNSTADVDLSGFVDTDDFTKFVTSFEAGC